MLRLRSARPPRHTGASLCSIPKASSTNPVENTRLEVTHGSPRRLKCSATRPRLVYNYGVGRRLRSRVARQPRFEVGRLPLLTLPLHSHHHELCHILTILSISRPTLFRSAETAMAAPLRVARPFALHKRFSKRHMAHEAFQTRPSAPPHANG